MSIKSLDELRKAALAVTALSALALPSARALEVARMELPEDFAAAAERLPARGYGGANRGRYAVGPYRGEFTRIESRFAALDPLYAANRGKASFTLEGVADAAPVHAECRFKERVVTVGMLTFDATRLAYVCDIGGGSAGTLTLGEPKPAGMKARVLARAERRGLAEIGSVRIDIASVHRYAGSKLGTQVPVGYLLSSGSQVVGAVELTDANPTFVLRNDIAGDVRHAAVVTALGLSVLRDPATSTLGD